MTQKVDFLIVGQGIAGTMLAWFLQKHGKSFIIIDSYNPSSSSQVAAGIIHPVTGRRIVKTWLADTLVPFSEKTYKEIEKLFSTTFFHHVPVLELINSAKEYNDWQARSTTDEMKDYINLTPPQNNYDSFLKSPLRKILINHSGWVNLKLFLQTFRNYYLEKQALIEDAFDHEYLKLLNDGIIYKNIEVSKIIFCEGVAAMKNTFWQKLPFLPAKGEILTIRYPAQLSHILTQKIFILPIGDQLFKVGSTYNWQDLTKTPTLEAKQQLLSQLEKIINLPPGKTFDVINHEASVRPSVKDRRPFLGLHPQHPQVGIFNGLGTKGCLLAPFFANHLAGFLTGNNELMSEVNVRQFDVE